MPQLLRARTAGSVDDGKSTLIGRLLYDSKAIFEDQLEAVERTSRERGDEHADLALLTDGLRAEREQGITIDVAHRYFATPHRKFIIADTPGHEQYTRNMVTGASTADLALILVDARKGILEQTRRHAFIASLLGIPHLVLCVNKMDLVGWSEDRFEEIKEEFRQFAIKLEVHDLTFIPVSALHGDNIVQRTVNMPWYEGASLLHHLEQVHVASDRNLIDARFPVQYVVRPQRQTDSALHDFRGYAGTVASGVFKPGDEVVVLPSGFTSTVSAIWGPGGTRLDEAFAPSAVCVQLADQLDVSRGDVLCRPNNRPLVGQELDAMVCWFSEQSSLTPDAPVHAAAHHPRHQGVRRAARLPARRQHPAPRRVRAVALAQRDRPHPAEDVAAADVRPLPPQPRDGQFHPRRRVDPQHRRRRDDHRADAVAFEGGVARRGRLTRGAGHRGAARCG